VNREEWLQGIAEAARIEALRLGFTMPDKVRVSVGFPSIGALARKRRRVGECWPPAAAADGVHQLFVSPVLKDVEAVLETVTHELSHTHNMEAKHRGAFQKVAGALGLKGGPWTATSWANGLPEWVTRAVAALGEFPHVALDPLARARKTQGTRMLKVECPECKYALRTSAKWIAVGLPTCPCGTVMACKRAEEGK
jgi:hypothetical protein